MNTASLLAVTLPPHKRLGRRPLRRADHDVVGHIEKGGAILEREEGEVGETKGARKSRGSRG